MLRYCLIITLLLLVGACGGGKKSSDGKNQSSTPVDASKKFTIGGIATGLKGNLAIANGDDTLTVGADGRFTFVKAVNEGALYSVKIVALPPNQLCELRNSKNYAYRNHTDIVIECATLAERNIRIAVPESIKLSELRLLSNYQAKGGQGEEQLSDAVTKMTVFDNSLVSLRNTDNQILFLSYLSNLAADEFEISSRSTAIALMLLEPTVVSAIQDRGLTIGQVADQLVTAVNANGDIDRLATEIQILINTKGNLNSPGTVLSASLGRVLDSAVRTIANSNALPAVPQNSLSVTPQNTASTTHHKLSVVSSSDALGIAFNYAKATDGSGTLKLSTTNQSARYVALYSDKFPSFTLKPYSNESFDVQSGVGFQENFNVVIAGPGALGIIADANVPKVLDAAITSGVNQYFLPSVNTLLGLKNPAGFTISDCLAEGSIKSLDSTSATQTSARDALLQDKYYRLLSGVSFNARNQFINGKNVTNQSPVEELFSCEKFGLGVLISNKKAIAVENTSGILAALNGVFNPANITASLNLFSAPNVSYLAEAIRNSYAERLWVLSSVLQFEIKANRTQVLAGDTVQFTSSCTVPGTNTAIACDVTWNFGNGQTATGNTASTKYVATGLYTVTATAKDADGAQQTQTLSVDALTFSQDNNAFGHWVVKHGNTELPFNSLRAKTFFDDDTNVLQIRLFAAFQQDNPQISLKLKGYDFNTNSRGDGVYSLEDASSGETCLGFYGDDSNPGKVFCTSTSGRTSSHPFTGSVTVSTDNESSSKKATFLFDAFDIACTTDIDSCDSIQVLGEMQFNAGF